MWELPQPEDDGLVVPEVGHWSLEKHHFLARYVDAFTTAMRKKNWSGLHYVDLFAGAGIERIEGSGQLGWGSPLIAAQAPYRFDGLHFCELDQDKHAALDARLGRIGFSGSVQTLLGDANEKAREIVDSIPTGTLSLAFLDPYGLHLDYATLEILAGRRVDLIIFFPVRLDILRNWEAYYWDNPHSNLDRVLGPGSNWRRIRDSTPKSQWDSAFLRLYQSRIARLGYKHFGYEPIPSGGAALYWLVFCSHSRTGANIWKKTSMKKPDGQKTFDFDGS